MQSSEYDNNDLSDCSPCPIDTCFGCVNGRCVIFSGDAENGCFYKDRSEALRQISHYFYRLISQERFDLLYRYADTYAKFGLMDHDIEDIRQHQAELEAFRQQDLAEDSEWIPPYAEWFCDSDSSDEKIIKSASADSSGIMNAPDIEPIEATSADYTSFNALPITSVQYDMREIASRENEESNQQKTEYKSWISEEGFHRVMLELYYCYFRESKQRNVSPSQRARETLGASIVYDTFREYITVLRLLWSGDYQHLVSDTMNAEMLMHRLIVEK